MDNTDQILAAIAELKAEISSRFTEMDKRFTEIELRLGVQEKRATLQTEATKKIEKAQAEQSEDIKALQKIVRDLARDKPARVIPQGTAILRKDAYPKFEEQGYTSRKAMKLLRDAGTIQTVREACTGKTRNSRVVRIDGEATRVIIVIE